MKWESSEAGIEDRASIIRRGKSFARERRKDLAALKRYFTPNPGVRHRVR